MTALLSFLLLLYITAPIFATGQPETPWERTVPHTPVPREVPAPAPSPPPPPPEPLHLSIIPGFAEAEYHGYWTALGGAMERAVADNHSWRQRWALHLEYPKESHENEVDRQIAMVEEAIHRNPHGIVIVPLDAAALAPHLTRAREEGITVLIPPINHAHGGIVAGEMIGSPHPNEPVVVIGMNLPTRDDRASGVRGVLGTSADIAYPMPSDEEAAYDLMWDLLSPPREAQAVIALDYFTGRAAVRALIDLGKAGSVTTIVFDPFPPLQEYMESGIIDGTVVDPIDQIATSLVRELLTSRNESDVSPAVPVLIRREDIHHREHDHLLRPYRQ